MSDELRELATVNGKRAVYDYTTDMFAVLPEGTVEVETGTGSQRFVLLYEDRQDEFIPAVWEKRCPTDLIVVQKTLIFPDTDWEAIVLNGRVVEHLEKLKASQST